MISKSTSYAIQALTYLASQVEKREYITISEIAEAVNVPYHFLKKILALLAQSGLLISQRSARGGVTFARDPRQITLLDIIKELDGPALFTECILNLPGCGASQPCALHNSWAVERNRLELMFSSTSLADVASRLKERNIRNR